MWLCGLELLRKLTRFSRSGLVQVGAEKSSVGLRSSSLPLLSLSISTTRSMSLSRVKAWPSIKRRFRSGRLAASWSLHRAV